MTTLPTLASSTAERWVTEPTVEHHAIVFEMLTSKGCLYLEALLAMMLEIETGGTFEALRIAA